MSIRARLTRVALSSALLTVLIIVGRFLVPADWGLRLALDSFLPWSGVFAGLALIAGLAAWRLKAIVVGIVPMIIWGAIFVPRITPLGVFDDATTQTASAADESVTIASQNVGADSSAIPAIIDALVAEAPDVIVLLELTQTALVEASERLGQLGYTESATVGTVGVWSTLPLSDTTPLDLGLGWYRALRVTVSSGLGDIRLYAIHAASVRWSGGAERNVMLAALGDELAADDASRLVVAGDFNATVDDASMAGILDTVQASALTDGGFGFTWPAQFPVTRPDQILTAGLSTAANVVLPESGSDHRGIAVTVTTAP